MAESRPYQIQDSNPTDFELTHHMVPGEPGRDHVEEMAEAFIIEFMRMRWTNERILEMFRNPFYMGPHYVYKAKGEQYVIDLIKNIRT